MSIQQISSFLVIDKRYPGSPDIVLPKYRTIVFIHGCFWHHHEGCKYALIPKSTLISGKINFTKIKSVKNATKKKLEEMEWRVITVWECQLKKCIDEETLEKLYNQITSNIRNMNFIYYSLFIYSLTLSLKVK